MTSPEGKPEESHGVQLRTRDYVSNSIEAVIKGVPYIGEPLHQFIYGPAAERRFRRIEKTLSEIGDALKAKNAQHNVANEDYTALLEDSLPSLARATNEDVRTRFRDLLINAATLPAGSPEWTNASLARELLSELDAVALAILAVLGRTPEAAAEHRRTVDDEPKLVSAPAPQLVLGPFVYDHPTLHSRPIAYDWPTVEEWVYRLREKRLIAFDSLDARGGFNGIRLTRLGDMLVRWSLADNESAT